MKSFESGRTIDDETLVRRIARGPAADDYLRVLYDRFADTLFAFIYYQLGEHAEAEDVWQDTWLAALRGIGSYRGRSGVFTWLCGIARHKIADHRRRLGRRADRVADAPLETLDLAGGPIPEEVLAHQDIRLRVVEALAALPDDYRIALVTRYADGYGVDEVARRLGKPYKAAESLLSRAKTAFRSAFMGKEPQDE
jgi:RNA polymerase sigma-70 factor (ECF subfamily)